MHLFIRQLFIWQPLHWSLVRIETHSHKYYLSAKGKVNWHHDYRLALHRLPFLISSWSQRHKTNSSQWFVTSETFLSSGLWQHRMVVQIKTIFFQELKILKLGPLSLFLIFLISMTHHSPGFLCPTPLDTVGPLYHLTVPNYTCTLRISFVNLYHCFHVSRLPETIWWRVPCKHMMLLLTVISKGDSNRLLHAHVSNRMADFSLEAC